MSAVAMARRRRKKPRPKKKPAPVAESAEFSSDDDVGDDECEDAADYRPGGYCPVRVGDMLGGRYRAVCKVGWGHFSTVWVAQDRNQGDAVVVLKIQKSAKHYREAALDEVDLLRSVAEGNGGGERPVVHLLNHFTHVSEFGKHVCFVFELLGHNLLKLVKLFDYQGMPLALVKHITYQVCDGLRYLHDELHIIHTDLKPENVLLTTPFVDTDAAVAQMEADLSTRSLTRAEKKRLKARQRKKKKKEAAKAAAAKAAESGDTSNAPETPEVAETPEAAVAAANGPVLATKGGEEGDAAAPSGVPVLRTPGGSAAKYRPAQYDVRVVDLGNACWTHKHFTDDIQTRQYRAPEVMLGCKWSTPVDMWSLACLTFELATGDMLFDPRAGSRHTKEDDHLAQFIELLGPIPKDMRTAGRHASKYLTRAGDLRNIRELQPWSLDRILVEKYKFPEDDATAMAAFLLPLLRYDASERATAAQCLEHEWLAGADKLEAETVALANAFMDKMLAKKEARARRRSQGGGGGGSSDKTAEAAEAEAAMDVDG